jgi:hypothetical protein
MKAGSAIGNVLRVDFTAMGFTIERTIANPIPTPEGIACDGERGSDSLYGVSPSRKLLDR